jgi:hypothetical protein
MAQLREFLNQRFPDNSVAPSHFESLLAAYQESRLAPPNLISEVTSGEEGKLWSHVWEALLYHHFASLKFNFRYGKVTKAGQHGPDFGIIDGDRTIWIEAVVPSPEGIPADWLEPPKINEVRVRSMPHQEMLLRWTSVLRDKRSQFEKYVQENIIPASDCTVVAINACRLSDFVGDDHGISQLPFAVEAVFPIGPLAIQLTSDGQMRNDPMRVPRHSLQKPSGIEVPTGNFLDPTYRNISGLLGCIHRDNLDGLRSLTLVHNPLAVEPLPQGILGASKEYVAEDKGDSYLLQPLPDSK